MSASQALPRHPSDPHKVGRHGGHTPGHSFATGHGEGGPASRRVIVGYDTKMVRPESLAAKVSDTGFKSQVAKLLTPEQFRESAGRMVGQMAGQPSGCCGGRGGCCTEKASAGTER